MVGGAVGNPELVAVVEVSGVCVLDGYDLICLHVSLCAAALNFGRRAGVSGSAADVGGGPTGEATGKYLNITENVSYGRWLWHVRGAALVTTLALVDAGGPSGKLIVARLAQRGRRARAEASKFGGGGRDPDRRPRRAHNASQY